MSKKIERFELNDIKDPNFVKKLNEKSLKVLCHDIRKEIISKTSQYGGHLSSNLGTVELTVALFRVFSFPKDKLIFDVGHQSYTEKILTGRSLERIGLKDGVSGFQSREESEYDVYDAGHSSTSLSAAEAFAIARDRKKEDYNVVAVIGDASIVNGLAFEALNNIGSKNNKVIIILNDNDMSIMSPIGSLGKFFRKISTSAVYNKAKKSYKRALYRTVVGRRVYSMSNAFKAHVKAALVPTTMFDNMGLTYIGPVDGHSIPAMERAFRKALRTTKSAVVHVRTIKGKGYKPAESDKNGYWHGVSPFNPDTGEPIDMHEGKITWSHLMGDLTDEMLKTHDDAFLVCPAMAHGSNLEQSFSDFPDRTMDVGISEEHAMTLSGGLALNGYHPIVAVYSTFLQRAFDELLHDVARLKVDATLLIDRAGLVGKDGETHQGIYDEAYLHSIPNVILSMPSTEAVAKALYAMSFEKGHGVFAIRYPHTLMEPEMMGGKAGITFGEPIKKQDVIEGKPAIVAVGPLGETLYERLKGQDIGFIDPVFLTPISDSLVSSLLKASDVFVYDAYGTENGFTEHLFAELMRRGYRGNVHSRTLKNVFVGHDSLSGQLSDNGLQVDQVIGCLKELGLID
jgi:1-deoxy-D-xylulose-5-phosphate synthase